MAPSPIPELENRLRRAVVARRYDDVRRIALEFCSAARTAIGQLLPGDPLRRETILHVDRTLEWSRVMMILARASLSSDLRRFTFLRKYVLNFPANPSAPNTRLEA
jgi:hypothetical protein